jgi:hypothetical protein
MGLRKGYRERDVHNLLTGGKQYWNVYINGCFQPEALCYIGFFLFLLICWLRTSEFQGV